MASVDVYASPDGDLVLDVLPQLGARFHRLRVRGHDVLRTPASHEAHVAEPFHWGAYPMVPWCNRIPGGRIAWDGVDACLGVNFGDHAIHGEAYVAPWETLGSGHYAFHGPVAFPWRYRSEVRVDLDDDAVSWQISVTNEDDTPMPAGLGYHPWFNTTGGLRVSVPAALAYDMTDDGLAVGPPHPVNGSGDLRACGPVPWGLDRVYAGLTASSLSLRWDDVDLSLSFSWTEAADHLVVAAFEELAAVAIEPQSHSGDAIGRLTRGEPGGASVLGPGETMALTYVLRVVDGPKV